MPSVEIKYFNALINNKPIFDQPVIKQTRSVWNIIEMSRNDDYTTGNLLDYLYHQIYYKLIGIDLSRQTNTSNQQINFTRKLEVDDGANNVFCLWKGAKNYSKLFFRFINYNRLM